MHVGLQTLVQLTCSSTVKQTHPTVLNAEDILKMIFANIAEGKAIHGLSRELIQMSFLMKAAHPSQ